jgi:hypothetical protein
VKAGGSTLAAIALAALLVAVAAGCGKSASPEEEWASSVCTAFGDWKDQIQKSTEGIKSQLQSPQQGMLTTIRSEAQSALDATNKLESDLKSIPPLTSDEGAKAKQEVESLATQAHTTVKHAQTTVNSLSVTDGVTAMVNTLAPLGSQFTSLATQMSTALSAVQSAGSSLADGFKDADSCKQFRSRS